MKAWLKWVLGIVTIAILFVIWNASNSLFYLTLFVIFIIFIFQISKKKGKMHYVIKSGLMGSGLGFLSLIIPFIFLREILINFLDSIAFPMIFLNLLIEPCSGESCVGMFLLTILMGLIVFIISFFIIGALIGWIIGKRKSKKQISSS